MEPNGYWFHVLIEMQVNRVADPFEFSNCDCECESDLNFGALLILVFCPLLRQSCNLSSLLSAFVDGLTPSHPTALKSLLLPTIRKSQTFCHNCLVFPYRIYFNTMVTHCLNLRSTSTYFTQLLLGWTTSRGGYLHGMGNQDFLVE